jgi:pimeloyl-ACP methyl ester carboxylesterase
MSETIPATAAESGMVSVPGGRLHVRDFAGAEPALAVMHGFPDDSRIYDRVARLLAPAGWWRWIGLAMGALTA